MSEMITCACIVCASHFNARRRTARKKPPEFCSRECKRKMPEAFWRHVDKTPQSGCWHWTGCLNPEGYGCISRAISPEFLAHRASWRIHGQEIPKGLFLCHHCDNRKCVNPAHLFLGTNQDNTQDMMNKERSAKDVPKPRLVECQVLDIINRAKSGERRTLIAASYSIPLRVIDRIMARKTWKHIQ